MILKNYFVFTDGGDLAAMKGHKGLENIVSTIGKEFVRYKFQKF